MSMKASMIELGECEIELNVETVLELLESNNNKVPYWLPVLLGSKVRVKLK